MGSQFLKSGDGTDRTFFTFFICHTPEKSGAGASGGLVEIVFPCSSAKRSFFFALLSCCVTFEKNDRFSINQTPQKKIFLLDHNQEVHMIGVTECVTIHTYVLSA